MRIHGRKELHWEGNDLFLKDRRMVGIYQKDNDPRMWNLGWNDDTFSKDYYNKTRAKEHAYREALKELNNGMSEEDLDSQETPLPASLVRLNDK